MGDSNPKSPPATASIPSWQIGESSVPPAILANGDQDQTNDSSQTESPSTRISLVEQASKFLEDDSIKDAPVEMKIQFLESKGLDRSQVTKLLGIDQDIKISDDSLAQIEETVHPQHQSSPTEQETTSSNKQSPIPASTPSRDVPPIITYPEFLLHIERPPPLITAKRLLTSLYAASGVAVIAYGASAFLVNPMVESLNIARHSLFETASTNLETLNEKLGKTVTVDPVAMKVLKKDTHQAPNDPSLDFDPADFFHRSTATQTTPGLSPTESSSDLEALKSESPLSDQQSRLQSLQTQLSDLLASNNHESDSSKAAKSRVDEFHHYLDKLWFGVPTITNTQFGEPGDAISKVKAEIRGVKGVLLSARSFPSGVGVRGRG